MKIFNKILRSLVSMTKKVDLMEESSILIGNATCRFHTVRQVSGQIDASSAFGEMVILV